MLGNGEGENAVKFSQRFAYGIGHVLNDICSAMWFSYTLLFFEVVLQMPSVLAGSVIFVGQFVDAVSSPVIGMLVDRYRTKKSWHMTGTGLATFSFFLIFSHLPWIPDSQTVVNGTESGYNGCSDETNTTGLALCTLYYSFLAAIFQIGWAMVQISHLAIIPEMTPDKCGRADLTAIRYTATVCSSVFVYIVTWFILHLSDGSHSSLGPKDSYKFKDVVLIGLLTGGIFTMLFHAILKPSSDGKEISRKIPTNSTKTWFAEIVEYFKSWELYQVTLVQFCSRMVLCVTLIYMPLYVIESFKNNPEYIATVPLVLYVASFVASMGMSKIRPFCSSKVSYFVGTLISTAAAVWIKIGLKNSEELFGVSVLLGVGSSITGVASLCLCADLIGTDTENGAFVYSIVTAVDKLLGGVTVIVIEKYKEVEVLESSHYYQDALAYSSGAFSLLGMVVLLTLCFTSLRSTREKPPNSSETVAA